MPRCPHKLPLCSLVPEAAALCLIPVSFISRPSFRSAHVSGVRRVRWYIIMMKQDFTRQLFFFEDRMNQPPFFCKICQQPFKNRRRLRWHVVTHGEKQHCCSLCNKSYFHLSDLKRHLTSHNQDEKINCPLCESAFSSKTYLRNHIIYIHNRKFPYNCDTCEQGYTSKERLELHRRTEHEGFRFVCDVCGKIFKDQRQFNIHTRKHNPDHVETVHKCEKCFKFFHTLVAYKQHLKRHEGGTWICEVCGKTLTSKSGLVVHRRLHSGEKQHICHVCGKAFAKREALIVHIRVHTKEKPHQCSVCDKSFSQRTTLVIHMRRHSGEKPYKCDVCGKGFVIKSGLNKHSCKIKS
ncbi:zinc finger protein 239-like [Zophobas morio]|uniref:zinc finger protein 239-like n=1 Tax=Zophobas morio TaxID=2755281 RepID=UPI003082D5E9